MKATSQASLHKHDCGFELGSTEKYLLWVVRAGLEPATSGFQVRLHHSATLPLPMINKPSSPRKFLCS